MKRWTLITGALLFACFSTLNIAQEVAQEPVPAAPGHHELTFTDWPGPDIAVHLFVPEELKAHTPIVIVMHGWSREAKRYFDDWAALAKDQGFVVVVPHFPVKDFRGSNDYNLGHVFEARGGDMRPQEQWTFSVIEPLFDDVIARLGGVQTEYTLYGHSAGSQFNWRVVVVEGADHNNAKMVPTAASLIPRRSAPENVLFVGNSFTYYNNSVHKHYRNLLNAGSEDGGASGNARMLAISGGSLAEHEGGLRQMLDGGQWDAVVLQGYSNGPITPGKVERFQEAARDDAKAIRQSGGDPVFFMTWAYTGQPQMTGKLDAAYSAIGAELNAKVVPVGLAFERALSLRPELTLIIDDGKHPTMAGTYLAACTFYAALQGESPEGLGYDAGLATSDAAFLQQVAWKIWQEYDAR